VQAHHEATPSVDMPEIEVGFRKDFSVGFVSNSSKFIHLQAQTSSSDAWRSHKRASNAFAAEKMPFGKKTRPQVPGTEDDARIKTTLKIGQP
jgi:hypothetical protein